MKGETEFVLIMYTQLIIFEILKKIFIFLKIFLVLPDFFFQLSLIKSIEISSFLGITFSYDQNSILYGRFKEWLVLKMYNPVRVGGSIRREFSSNELRLCYFLDFVVCIMGGLPKS